MPTHRWKLVRVGTAVALAAGLLVGTLSSLAGEQERTGHRLGIPDVLVLSPTTATAVTSPATGASYLPGGGLVVAGGPAPRYLYLGFDVTGLPLGTRDLVARIQLTVTDVQGEATLGIVPLPGGLAVGDAVRAAAAARPLAVGSPDGGGRVEFDVSAAVTGKGRHAFAVVAEPRSTGRYAVLDSAAEGPVLRLDYRRPGRLTGDEDGTVEPIPPPVPAAATVRLPSVPDAQGCTVSVHLVPSCGAWLGVAPGSFSEVPKPEALAAFEAATGTTMDVVHTYHRAGQLFPTPAEIAMAREPGRRRMLFLNYKPEGGHTWTEVAEGRMDPELDRLARHMRTVYADPFFFTVHHEPEEEVREAPGSGFRAADYAAMFRHVVERLRAGGVTNAVTVFNVMGSSKYGSRQWFDRLYPGDDVVDWIGWDPYACVDPDDPCGDYRDLINRTFDAEWPGFYDYVRHAHPGKPLMLAEWGVIENGPPERKADVFTAVANQVAGHPEIKALIYFDAAVSPLGDSRVDSTPASLAAYRQLAALPWFAQRPP
jgi:hypothetical protein